MKIVYTKHAKEKFTILRKQKFIVQKSEVNATLRKPDLLDNSRLPLLIAQKSINEKYILRVVFKTENNDIIKIITFYPARKKKYENEK